MLETLETIALKHYLTIFIRGMTKSKVVSEKKSSLPPRPVKAPKIKDECNEDEYLEEESSNLIEKGERAPRKKATIQSHIEKYNELLALLDAEISRKSREKEKGVRSFRKARKLVLALRKELPQVTRSKIARSILSTRKNIASGITKKFQISKELAEFLKVPEDTELSRVEATNGICVYAHLKKDEKRESMLRWKHLNPGCKRNLQNPKDKKAILPDAALTKLLRYSQYKKDVAAGKIKIKSKDKTTGKKEEKTVENDLMYYYVIQKLIGPHFLVEDEDEEIE